MQTGLANDTVLWRKISSFCVCIGPGIAYVIGLRGAKGLQGNIQCVQLNFFVEIFFSEAASIGLTNCFSNTPMI